MLKRKIFIIVVHCFVWLLFAIMPLIIFYGQPFNRNYTETLSSPYYWLFLVTYIFIFYVTTYFLIPEFYLKKKYTWYAMSMFLVFVAFFFLKPFELLVYYSSPNVRDIPYYPFSIDVISIFIYLVIVSMGIALQIIRQWRLAELQAKQAEAEKLKAVAEKKTAELSFLKAQINPHFLFNTLNNIYSLAITHSANTAPSIMKLSNIMRYLTDDATKEFVALEREVACIRDYINLQSLRLGKNIKVDFSVSGNTENKKIAPLILITFIENVFKYGITTHEPADIIIKLFSDRNNITFFSQNRIFEHQTRIENTGIGLANTRHRLELIYPKKHTLNINEENGLFSLYLTLQDLPV